ncbi:hypothetical protein [Bdellovibrio sp. HCB209]|uniref:hypothetical protein n=1 Tax=Bdellovibrio sp. HCB209 TaxID=3394354 RepID=UPI0039B4AD29
MKNTILFLLFSIYSIALAAAPVCENVENKLRDLNSKIFSEDSAHFDMTATVREAMSLVKECKVEMRKLGVPDSLYTDALANNRRDEITRQKFMISLYAQSGKIDAKVSEFQKYLTQGKDTSSAKNKSFVAEMQELSKQSYAEELQTCSAIDLRDKTGPVRNQGTDGWCYAYTVANMVSWKTGKEISAAAVAFGYTDNAYHDLYRLLGMTQHQVTNQGFTTAAFRASKSKGFCLEKELPSEGFNGIEGKMPLAVLDKMGKEAISGKISQDEFMKVAKAMFPNLSKEQFAEVLKKAGKDTYFNKLVNNSCKNRISGNGLEMSFFQKLDNKKFATQIEQHLQEGRPVEIGYNADFFKYANSPSGMAYHSSLLVGRRMNAKTGQCEYLLKNTYGKSWKPDSSEFESEGGYAWVPKARMIEATRNASYVK